MDPAWSHLDKHKACWLASRMHALGWPARDRLSPHAGAKVALSSCARYQSPPERTWQCADIESNTRFQLDSSGPLLRPLGRSGSSLVCLRSAVCSCFCTHKPWWIQALDQIHVPALEGWENENSNGVILFGILLFTVAKKNKLLIARDMTVIE